MEREVGRLLKRTAQRGAGRLESPALSLARRLTAYAPAHNHASYSTIKYLAGHATHPGLLYARVPRALASGVHQEITLLSLNSLTLIDKYFQVGSVGSPVPLVQEMTVPHGQPLKQNLLLTFFFPVYMYERRWELGNTTATTTRHTVNETTIHVRVFHGTHLTVYTLGMEGVEFI